MRFFLRHAIALLLLAVCPMRLLGQVADSPPTDAAKQSAVWQGTFANGTPLTRERLEALLAAHQAWLRTAEKTLREEQNKPSVRAQVSAGGEAAREVWNTLLQELITSDWEKENGRLILQGAKLRGANLQGAQLDYATLKKTELSEVNLRQANLRGADLHEADLFLADLSEADLNNANLHNATLRQAKLEKTKLRFANLHHAALTWTNLRNADLAGANLSEATLSWADLRGADLSNWSYKHSPLVSALQKLPLSQSTITAVTLPPTNLRKAELIGSDLTGADLSGADLTEAILEFTPGTLPSIPGIALARNLSHVTYRNAPYALVELREAVKNKGLRPQERALTYAIKRSEYEHAWKGGARTEPMFNYVFFDVPVAYGLYPGRALRILVALIPVFALFYGLAIMMTQQNHGIYRVWPKERIEMGQTDGELVETIKVERLNTKSIVLAVAYMLYFSLLSAFHIGWREFNVGNWITRLQAREYTLRATGWVRTISGLQSLISVYLLALWALTYFGRPFE